jgi:hypothetical protein
MNTKRSVWLERLIIAWLLITAVIFATDWHVTPPAECAGKVICVWLR